MNIYVMVDMEGISGIMDPRQVSTAEGQYYESEGRKFMTLDANACIEGCFRGGAQKVIVRDAHAGGKNFFWDQLDSRAEFVMGSVGDTRMPGIEECDGVILLGYHAMAGTEKGILEHTFSSKAWQNLWINGEPAGEAVQKCTSISPYSVKRPVTFRLERIERGGLPSQIKRPYVKVIDGRTFEVTCDSFEEALVKITE